MKRLTSRLRHTPFGILIAVFFWFFIWEIAALCLSEPLILPTPIAVFTAFPEVFRTTKPFYFILFSLTRVLLGFLLGVIFGVLLALASYRFPPLETLFSPLLSAAKATPVASFIMLLWMLAGAKRVPSIIAALMVLPIIYGSFLVSLKCLSPELSEVCKLYKIPFAKRLRIYYAPSMLPAFSSSFITAFGLSWKAGIAAEVMAQTEHSIGKEIALATWVSAKELYAWTIVVILVSLLLEGGVRFLFRRFVKGGKLNDTV